MIKYETNNRKYAFYIIWQPSICAQVHHVANVVLITAIIKTIHFTYNTKLYNSNLYRMVVILYFFACLYSIYKVH